jgi:integrase/recombinase XerD
LLPGGTGDCRRGGDAGGGVKLSARLGSMVSQTSRLFPAPAWQSIPRASIRALVRRVQKRWPPEPMASDPGETLCRAVCSEYRGWLSVQRGLAVASVDDLMWEARHFLSWYKERAGVVSFRELRIQNLDAYFEIRAPGLRRKSRKDVAQQLRSLMRYLHSTGRTAVDLAAQIIAPMTAVRYSTSLPNNKRARDQRSCA